jgi:pimeloyl-ACP methyl ester carboxylesterase
MVINIENQTIYYEIAGAGEKTVVFLHGWGGSIANFKGCFNVLAREFRVVNLELPGFGQSPPPAYPFGTADYARIVSGFIRAVCAGPVYLVGHSFGGRIALVLAADGHGLAEKAVLIDSAGLKPRRGIKYRFRVRRYKFIRMLVKRKLLNEKRLKKYGSDDYRALSPDMRATFTRVVNERLEKYAARITVPTLILWGGKDTDTPVYMSKRLKKLIKGSELHIFPEACHYSYVDCFGESVAVMRRFFIKNE